MREKETVASTGSHWGSTDSPCRGLLWSVIVRPGLDKKQAF